MRPTVNINRNGVLSHDELQLLVDALSDKVLKDKRSVECLKSKLKSWMERAPSWAPINHKTPIKSSMPNGIFKRESRSDWSYHRSPKTRSPRAPKKKQSADDIIASL